MRDAWPTRLHSRAMPARSRSLAALAAGLALLLSACGGGDGDTAQLEDNLAAQRAAIDALQERMAELTDEVGQVTSRDPLSGVNELTERLDEMTTRLEDVETGLAEQADEDVTATVAAEIGKFGEQVEELVASVRDLTTVVAQLRRDLDDLEARFEQHADDPFGHGRGGGDDEATE